MSDQDLQQDVQNALDDESSVGATEIGVTVDAGVVTLRGRVSSLGEKMTAERVARRVSGAKAVTNDLMVHFPAGCERTDTEIAEAVVAAWKWNVMVPADRVTASVSDGWITIKGSLEWQFQKDARTRAVRDLAGVRGVINEIVIRPHVNARDVQVRIDVDPAGRLVGV